MLRRLLRAHYLAPPVCHAPAAKSGLSEVRVSPAIRPVEERVRLDETFSSVGSYDVLPFRPVRIGQNASVRPLVWEFGEIPHSG